MLPYKFLVNKITKEMKKYNDIDCKYRANLVGDYNVRKETFPKEFYDELIDVQFEDGKFPISKHYDEMLTKIYGNYMKLPKVEDRKVKHHVIVRK